MALCALATAQETVRSFPPAALRGTMQITNPPDMLLNGQAARLSPGARIRGVNNMLVMSGALAGQSVVVNYVRDSLGLVQDVWILNATEAQQSMRRTSANASGIPRYAFATPDMSASGASLASARQN